MPVRLKRNSRIFTKSGIEAEILAEVAASIPPKTKAYVIGGAARNSVYYDLFKKSLPQRDFDILLIGNLNKFVKTLKKKKFIYGKIRRKNEIVLMKKLVPTPKIITDYLVLDIHRSDESSVLKNLKLNSAFTINGFAIPLNRYLMEDSDKYLIALSRAKYDLKNHNLRLNSPGYKVHPGNLFACLRFMSIGFSSPGDKSIELLLKQLPKLEKWRFEKNVKKVFRYIGSENKARKLVKKLGIKIDVFNFDKLKIFATKNK